MFRRLIEADRRLTITVDGVAVEACETDTVMAALLAHGVDVFRRSAVSGAPCGPYCGIGACFECLVTIDGEPNRQACLVPVRQGMLVLTGHGAPRLKPAGQA